MIGQFPSLESAATEVSSLVLAKFAVADLDQIVLLASQAAAAVFGSTLAEVLGRPSTSASVSEEPSGSLAVMTHPGVAWAGTRILVVTPAVETGQSAQALAATLRSFDVAWLGLVATVCPRDAEPLLRPAFDQIEAVIRPFGRRSAAWHLPGLDRGSVPPERPQAI